MRSPAGGGPPIGGAVVCAADSTGAGTEPVRAAIDADDIARINRLIKLFGDCHKLTMRAERRTSMKSALFDLPRRSSLGWDAYYEHAPGFLRELSARATPDALGRKMRTIGCRPYALQAFMLMCSYLAGRQQRMLDAGVRIGEPFADEDLESLVLVVDFWGRLMNAYRGDADLLPEAGDHSLRILDDDEIAAVVAELAAVTAERFARVRRAAATLELYSYIVHGEQRDGIFGHGPYRLADGATLFFKEYNDLRNGSLPWANTPTPNLASTVAVAYAARDVAVRCDLFGSSLVEPPEFGDRVERLAVVSNTASGIAPISDAELGDIEAAAAQAQAELYMEVIGWDERYKIAYGAPLFANHLAPFFELAGAGEGAYERIAAAFDATAERLVDSLQAAPVPSMWEHFASTPGDFYWPAAPPGGDGPPSAA